MKTDKTPLVVEGKPYRRICPDWDFRKYPKTDHFCAICQKDIKPGKPYREIHIVDGGGVILHPADEALYVEHGDPLADLGCHPIGPECARRLGLEWSTEPRPTVFEAIHEASAALGASNPVPEAPLPAISQKIEQGDRK